MDGREIDHFARLTERAAVMGCNKEEAPLVLPNQAPIATAKMSFLGVMEIPSGMAERCQPRMAKPRLSSMTPHGRVSNSQVRGAGRFLTHIRELICQILTSS